MKVHWSWGNGCLPLNHFERYIQLYTHIYEPLSKGKVFDTKIREYEQSLILENVFEYIFFK